MIIKACLSCGKERKYLDHEVRRGRASDYCQPCSAGAYWKDKPKRTAEQKAEYQRNYYQENKDRLSEYYSDYRERIRFEMVEAYGGKCYDCGEVDPIVLVLDHIFDDATDVREFNNQSGYKLYMKLKNAGWPQERYQLLCCNCNWRKEYRRRKDAVSERETG